MEVDQPRFKESVSIGGGDGRIGGTRVKVAKRVGEVSPHCGGKDVEGTSGELSSSAGKWGSGEKSVRAPGGEVHAGGAGAGVKVGLTRVGLFGSAVAVGRVGPAYIGKGGAAVGGGAVRGLDLTGTGAGGTWANHEGISVGISVGSGKGPKGRTGSSETGDDEGYYAHSYGQLAIHREMLQV